jgi:hypothetical protein
MAPKFVGGVPRFVLTALASFTAYRIKSGSNSCSVSSTCPRGYMCGGSGVCVMSSTHYHDAVDPDFTYDYTTYLWKVAPGISAAATPSLWWAESNWAVNIATRVYRRDQPAAPYVLLAVGIAVTLATALGTHVGRRYCRKHLKIA